MIVSKDKTSMYKSPKDSHINPEVIYNGFIKKTSTKERVNGKRRKVLDKFNSVTNNKKLENQNQTHNSKKEGISPINRNR